MSGEPTSVLLRQAQRDLAEAQQSLTDTVADLLATQKALAASQQDLTGVEDRLREVEAERDEARQTVRMLRANEEIRARVIRERNTERERLHVQLAAALDDRDFVERELTASHAQLAAARLEIDQLRAERNAAWELAGHTPDREEPTT